MKFEVAWLARGDNGQNVDSGTVKLEANSFEDALKTPEIYEKARKAATYYEVRVARLAD